MENPLNITALNDFIFCPVSIYFHSLYKYAKKFEQSDSVMIIKLNPNCQIKKYGYAKNEDADLFVI